MTLGPTRAVVLAAVLTVAACGGEPGSSGSRQEDRGEAGRVVFARRTGADHQVHLGLFTVHLDGSGESPFLADAAPVGMWFESAGFSPDGTEVALALFGEDRIDTAVAGADSGGYRELGLARGSFSVVCDRWSRDGDRLACSGVLDPERSGIYTVRPDGSDLTRITDVPVELQRSHHDLPCGFSLDGGRIAFLRLDTERQAGDGDLYVVNADGTGERLISDVGVDFGCDWSPVGDELIASGGSGELYLIGLDGDVTTLSRPPALVNTFAPSFSPDGTAIVFSGWTDAEGEADIFTMRLDGSSLVQLTDTPDAKEEMAVWAP